MKLPEAEAKSLCEVRAILTDLICMTKDPALVAKLQEARRIIRDDVM